MARIGVSDFKLFSVCFKYLKELVHDVMAHTPFHFAARISVYMSLVLSLCVVQ